jgi:hypothetical protein
MRHCRIFTGPVPIPTLRAYPPPAPVAPRPVVHRRKVDEPFPDFPTPLSSPLRRRARQSKLRDCMFLPDMSAAIAFLQARRAVGAPGSEPGRDAVSALESPLAIGLLMLVMPPVAVTLAWASPRFGRTAQIALTAYGALVTVVMAVMVAVAMG